MCVSSTSPAAHQRDVPQAGAVQRKAVGVGVEGASACPSVYFECTFYVLSEGDVNRPAGLISKAGDSILWCSWLGIDATG